MKLSKSLPLIALCAVAYAPTAASAAPTIKSYFEFKQPKMITIPGDLSLDSGGASAPVSNVSSTYTLGFEGISQYDGASFGRNFIPPDTMGAVGRTQYFETSNGAYAVFDKYTGQRLSLVSDVAFWNCRWSGWREWRLTRYVQCSGRPLDCHFVRCLHSGYPDRHFGHG
jgi:hypothetical protein